jgi:predicted transposase YbfD/YdcC
MVETIRRYFGELPDPRHRRGRRHRLDEMIIMAILAVICSADSWQEVAHFARAKEKWLRSFLELPHGVPSHDTFGRVFSVLEPEAFERCFLAWIGALAQRATGGLIAVDGKTLRHSFDRASEQAAIHMVSAWSVANNLVFGQLATETKSNEITAIPKLLDLLDLRGTVVSIDAMGCQRTIARQIVERGGDYLLALKGNQSTMHDEVTWWLDHAIAGQLPEARLDYHEQVHKDHGRLETRKVWSTEQVDWFADRHRWAGLGALVVVDSARRWPDGRVEQERRYYISSRARASAQHFGRCIRSHWHVENKLHWSLDVSFGEDACRVRKGYAAENFSRLRRMALNLLKRETTEKIGIKAKRLRAGWDEDYLLKVLTA